MPHRTPVLYCVDPSRLLNLPVDILLVILAQCRIDELLALRLTAHALENLIKRHISTIAPSVARSTFPESRLLLTPPQNCSQYTLQWLLGLIPRHLAAILVDRTYYASHPSYSDQDVAGIPAEDPFGDELRARVTNGWRVLHRLSMISQSIPTDYVVQPSDCLPLKSHHIGLAEENTRPSRREHLILKHQLSYVNQLPLQLIRDFFLLRDMLDGSWNFIDRVSEGDQGYDISMKFSNKLWLWWFTTQVGLSIWWKQWWILPPHLGKNHFRDEALKTLRTSAQLFVDRRDCQWELRETMRVRIQTSRSDSTESLDPLPYMLAHVNRPDRSNVKDTMSHIPFESDFYISDAGYDPNANGTCRVLSRYAIYHQLRFRT